MTFRARFNSSRGIPLITQEVFDSPVLTIENTTQWENLYLIKPDGTVTQVVVDEDKLAFNKDNEWSLFCIHTTDFAHLANKLGASYGDVVSYLIHRRWKVRGLRKEAALNRTLRKTPTN